MTALEKLVYRANEMDMTEQENYLGDVFMPALAQKELARHEAIEAAAQNIKNNHRLLSKDEIVEIIAAALLDRQP